MAALAHGSARLRRGEPADADAVAELLYTTATGVYDTYVGGHDAALTILRAAYARSGNSASHEVVTVADADGDIAGALAAFPVGDGNRRARRFLRIMLMRSPPWRWRAILRFFRLGAEATPPAPPSALYVDALATAQAYRRTGVARALLDEAVREAEGLGLTAVALDAAVDNAPARSLYERAGFEVTERRAGIDRLPAIVGYVRQL